MENEPRSFLRNVDIGSQLNGGNALLMARNQVHCNEPLSQGNLSVLKDSTYGNREVRLAVVATVTPILSLDAMMAAAPTT